MEREWIFTSFMARSKFHLTGNLHLHVCTYNHIRRVGNHLIQRKECKVRATMESKVSAHVAVESCHTHLGLYTHVYTAKARARATHVAVESVIHTLDSTLMCTQLRLGLGLHT